MECWTTGGTEGGCLCFCRDYRGKSSTTVTDECSQQIASDQSQPIGAAYLSSSQVRRHSLKSTKASILF